MGALLVDPTQELVVGYGCRGCNRIAKTERGLLAHGCEGKHEPVIYLSDYQALEAQLEGLQKAAQEAVRALRYRMAWQAADDLEVALQPEPE